MNDLKKNIRRVFWLYCAMFAVLVCYLCRFILVDSEAIVDNPYNTRLKLADERVARGRIVDSAGVLLAGNGDGGRVYPYGRAAAHLVGTTLMGKSGVESRYNRLLQQPGNEIAQLVRGLTGEHSTDLITGDTAVLTIDAGLQELVYTAMGDNRGAAVVLEPATGRVLALVSKPDFDPETVDADWEYLQDEAQNSPLLNRATQGLYPPGSIFKLLTAAAGLQNGYAEFTYDCGGQIEIDGNRIRCYNSKVHGQLGMTEAMAVSCNGYFAALAVEMGAVALDGVCRHAFFGNDLGYAIERGRSEYSLGNDATTESLMQTAIGQGRTLVTPLHMAMLAGAAANGGQMMKPYVLERRANAFGKTKRLTLPAALGQAFDYDTADALRLMMVEAVETGTAAPARVDGVTIAAKTGTAENSGGDDHGWVIAFAPAGETDKPQLAIAVVMENSGGPKKGLELVRRVVEEAVAR